MGLSHPGGDVRDLPGGTLEHYHYYPEPGLPQGAKPKFKKPGDYCP